MVLVRIDLKVHCYVMYSIAFGYFLHIFNAQHNKIILEKRVTGNGKVVTANQFGFMLSVVYYVDVCLGHVISQIDAVLVYSQQLPVVRQPTITLVSNITSDTRDLIIINNVACYYIK